MPATGPGVGAAISRNGTVLPGPSFPRRNLNWFRRCVPPAEIIDKPAYWAFYQSPLASFLSKKGVGTLVITGAETDVCVLATVLDAVDLGFRVVIVEDALCSSSDAGHDALMTLYRTRYSEQIELIKAAEMPEVWLEAA
jgi:nicotinamidase-related amidase